MESMRREYDAKLEGKSSKWSWFWWSAAPTIFV
jgi:hypothetical protein